MSKGVSHHRKTGRPKGVSKYAAMTKVQTSSLFYASGKANQRPYGVQCWCYRCSRVGLAPYHRWVDPCPAAT